MNIEPNATIEVVSLISVRNVLRTFGNLDWTELQLADALGLPRSAALELISELQDRGYIEPMPGESGHWTLTADGVRLVDARAARRMHWSTTERHLRQFLDRVVEVNDREDFAYRVRRVTVFGSFLTSDWDDLGDIDLAIELVPREREADAQRALEECRIEATEASGRRFSTFLARYVWPQEEVCRFLRARSNVISLHSVAEVEAGVPRGDHL